jgi:hypothetical protein
MECEPPLGVPSMTKRAPGCSHISFQVASYHSDQGRPESRQHYDTHHYIPEKHTALVRMGRPAQASPPCPVGLHGAQDVAGVLPAPP